MLSIWTKSIGLRSLNLLSHNNKYFFAPYGTQNEQQNDFSNKHKKDYFANRKLFKTQNPTKKFDKFQKPKNQNDSNVEEMVKTINEINKEFLGIKLNTDYFKVYNQRSFEDVCKPDKTQFYKVNDLPFNVKSKNTSSEQSSTQSQASLPNSFAVQMLNSMISEQKLKKELERLAKTYFSDLLLRERKSRLEANFESESRKVIQTLKSNKWNFKLAKTDTTPKVTLKNVNILKGIRVNRNDNYTIDSYQTNLDEIDQGITTYTLWKKQREEYPEAEWFAQKFIVARIEADVQNCPIVDVTEENMMHSSTKGLTHSFVFQADLTVPPSLSLLSLTPQEHLKSYRLKPENIYITNVDNKNIWFNIAFKEDEKKSRLVNKIK